MTNEPIEELKKKLVAICPKCGAAFSQPLTEMNEAFGGTGTIWECGERDGNDEQAPGCRIRVLEAELQAANAKLAAIEEACSALIARIEILATHEDAKPTLAAWPKSGIEYRAITAADYPEVAAARLLLHPLPRPVARSVTTNTNRKDSPMKFRKKPVVIEAMRLPEKQDGAGIVQFGKLGVWLGTEAKWTFATGGKIEIETLEGTMTANPGDWIIRGVKGELYPCKPDIFAATYEPA